VNTTLLFETIDSFLTDISNVRLVEAGSVMDFCLDLRQIVSSEGQIDLEEEDLLL